MHTLIRLAGAMPRLRADFARMATWATGVVALTLMSANLHAAPSSYVATWADTPAPTAADLTGGYDFVPRPGGRLRLGVNGNFDNFNPFATRGLVAAWTPLTFETLGQNVGSDDTYVLSGLLAQSFDVASDHRSMVVTLRPEARFSNGASVTADDVAFTFEALVRDAAPTYRQYYREIEKVEVLGPRTVRFVFKTDRNRELPLIVAQLPVLSRADWAGRSIADPQQKPIVGSGPYQFESWKWGSYVKLKRNPNYWGWQLPINRGRYNFDEVTLTYYRDLGVMRQAFFAGQLDYFVERSIKDWELAYDVPAVQRGRIERAVFPSHQTFGMSGVFMNLRRAPLNDIRVRQALALVFDFERLNASQFYGSYERSLSFWSGSTRLAASDPLSADDHAALKTLVGDTTRFDALPRYEGLTTRDRLRQAQTLLAQAGYRLTNGVMQNAQGQALRFNLILNSPTTVRTFSQWAQDLKRMGVTLNLVVLDATQYVQRIRHFDYDLAYLTVRQSSQPGNEQASFFGSQAASLNGSRNYAGLQNEWVDTLVARIANPQNQATLTQNVRLLDRILRVETIVVPGWFSSSSRIAWARYQIAPPAENLLRQKKLDFDRWYCVPCQGAAQTERPPAPPERLDAPRRTDLSAESTARPTS